MLNYKKIKRKLLVSIAHKFFLEQKEKKEKILWKLILIYSLDQIEKFFENLLKTNLSDLTKVRKTEAYLLENGIKVSIINISSVTNLYRLSLNWFKPDNLRNSVHYLIKQRLEEKSKVIDDFYGFDDTSENEKNMKNNTTTDVSTESTFPMYALDYTKENLEERRKKLIPINGYVDKNLLNLSIGQIEQLKSIIFSFAFEQGAFSIVNKIKPRYYKNKVVSFTLREFFERLRESRNLPFLSFNLKLKVQIFLYLSLIPSSYYNSENDTTIFQQNLLYIRCSVTNTGYGQFDFNFLRLNKLMSLDTKIKYEFNPDSVYFNIGNTKKLKGLPIYKGSKQYISISTDIWKILQRQKQLLKKNFYTETIFSIFLEILLYLFKSLFQSLKGNILLKKLQRGLSFFTTLEKFVANIPTLLPLFYERKYKRIEEYLVFINTLLSDTIAFNFAEIEFDSPLISTSIITLTINAQDVLENCYFTKIDFSKNEVVKLRTLWKEKNTRFFVNSREDVKTPIKEFRRFYMREELTEIQTGNTFSQNQSQTQQTQYVDSNYPDLAEKNSQNQSQNSQVENKSITYSLFRNKLVTYKNYFTLSPIEIFLKDSDSEYKIVYTFKEVESTVFDSINLSHVDNKFFEALGNISKETDDLLSLKQIYKEFPFEDIVSKNNCADLFKKFSELKQKSLAYINKNFDFIDIYVNSDEYKDTFERFMGILNSLNLRDTIFPLKKWLKNKHSYLYLFPSKFHYIKLNKDLYVEESNEEHYLQKLLVNQEEAVKEAFLPQKKVRKKNKKTNNVKPLVCYGRLYEIPRKFSSPNKFKNSCSTLTTIADKENFRTLFLYSVVTKIFSYDLAVIDMQGLHGQIAARFASKLNSLINLQDILLPIDWSGIHLDIIDKFCKRFNTDENYLVNILGFDRLSVKIIFLALINGRPINRPFYFDDAWSKKLLDNPDLVFPIHNLEKNMTVKVLKPEVKEQLQYLSELITNHPLSNIFSNFFISCKENNTVYGQEIPENIQGGTQSHHFLTTIEGLLLDAIIFDLHSYGDQVILINLEYDGLSIAIKNDVIALKLDFPIYRELCRRILGDVVPLTVDVWARKQSVNKYDDLIALIKTSKEQITKSESESTVSDSIIMEDEGLITTSTISIFNLEIVAKVTEIIKFKNEEGLLVCTSNANTNSEMRVYTTTADFSSDFIFVYNQHTGHLITTMRKIYVSQEKDLLYVEVRGLKLFLKSKNFKFIQNLNSISLKFLDFCSAYNQYFLVCIDFDNLDTNKFYRSYYPLEPVLYQSICRVSYFCKLRFLINQDGFCSLYTNSRIFFNGDVPIPFNCLNKYRVNYYANGSVSFIFSFSKEGQFITFSSLNNLSVSNFENQQFIDIPYKILSYKNNVLSTENGDFSMSVPETHLYIHFENDALICSEFLLVPEGLWEKNVVLYIKNAINQTLSQIYVLEVYLLSVNPSIGQ